MEFVYTTDTSDYQGFLNKPIIDFRSKHVMALASDRAKQLYVKSLSVGYPEVMWGYGSGLYQREDENRLIQIHRIARMIYKQERRAFRIVIDSAGVLWIDNLHSAIRDILVYGESVWFGNVSCYIIDLTRSIPIVADVSGSLSRNLDDIEGAIAVAKKRDGRTNAAVRAVGYSIREFLMDNAITKESLRLDERYFEVYRNGQ